MTAFEIQKGEETPRTRAQLKKPWDAGQARVRGFLQTPTHKFRTHSNFTSTTVAYMLLQTTRRGGKEASQRFSTLLGNTSANLMSLAS
jgi:hypothetical protein